MGILDKAKDKAEVLKGRAKEGLGKVTADPRLEAKGKGERVKGNLKQAGEKVKDAFRR